MRYPKKLGGEEEGGRGRKGGREGEGEKERRRRRKERRKEKRSKSGSKDKRPKSYFGEKMRGLTFCLFLPISNQFHPVFFKTGFCV